MSSASPECHLFVGPTLWGSKLHSLLPPEIAIEKPVQRHAVRDLVRREAPGVIAIVDGYFDQTLAVGHRELLMAIQSGWQVWGLSSMGAIRACEMRSLGMRGFGWVYQQFIGEADYRDDEVALLHAPDAPYRPISEPLVHLRCGLADLRAQNVLAPHHADAIIDELTDMWFGDRYLQSVANQVASYADAQIARQWLESFDQYRVKTNDLASFLKICPWKSPTPAAN